MPQISMIPLPFEPADLTPFISKQTFSFHYNQHYKAYINKTNELIQETEFASLQLEEIVKKAGSSSNRSLFNQASQAWNHEFFWKSLCKHTDASALSTRFNAQIVNDFGSIDQMLAIFKESALSQFGSGWIWLTWKNDRLAIEKTNNADRPQGIPLLVVDVWEHAYYLDYQNRRNEYINAVVDHTLNLKFSDNNFLNIF